MVWDEHAQRFFFSAVTSVRNSAGGGNNGLTFGWSKTNNPSSLTTHWCRLRLRFNRTGLPDLGTMCNSQKVVARGDAFWSVCPELACEWGDYVNATPDTINPA